MNAEEFVGHCSSFMRLVEQQHKKWVLKCVDGKVFLCLKKMQELKTRRQQRVTSEEPKFTELPVEDDPGEVSPSCTELYEIEYHVYFNESYGVPTLLFNIYNESGKRMNMQNAWDALDMLSEAGATTIYQALTMTEHPLLFQPFLCIHPCKTKDILSSLPGSANPVVTFLSTYGPFVRLGAADLPSFALMAGGT